MGRMGALNNQKARYILCVGYLFARLRVDAHCHQRVHIRPTYVHTGAHTGGVNESSRIAGTIYTHTHVLHCLGPE